VQHVLGLPSSAPCDASFVGVLLTRRQGESRDAVPKRRGGAHLAAGSRRASRGWAAVDDTGHPRVIVLVHRLMPIGIA